MNEQFNAPHMPANFSVDDYPAIKCPKCGCDIFSVNYRLRIVPGLLFGYGDDSIYFPSAVYVCHDCGEVVDTQALMDKLKEKKQENKPSLIV